MANNIKQSIVDKIYNLPAEEQKAALEFVETLEKKVSQRNRPIWDVIEEISGQIPDEEWVKIPSDASLNLDHYLYGAPKRTK